MNEDQRQKLDELIAELETLPTPELIREACKVVALSAPPAGLKRRMEAAMDAAISAQLVLAYLPVLRQVEDWRWAIGQQIYVYREQSERLFPVQLEGSVRLAVQVSQMIGEQDVIRHYWVVTVGRIQRLLEKLARETGYKLNGGDRRLMEGYRDLRDYYEHLEGELPGARSGKQQNGVEETIEEIHITFGLEMDVEGRTILGDKRIDVNSQGLRAIEDLVERVYLGSRGAAIGKVQTYFQKHPDTIPSRNVVDPTLLASVSIPGARALNPG